MGISSKHPPAPELLNLSPFNLCLVTLFGEVRGEPVEGQVGVANVLRNRLHSGRWGSTYHDVILSWAQFSCLWKELDGLNHQRVIDFARRVSEIEHYTERERQLAWVTQGLFSDSIRDNTFGATHYYADYIAPPAWTAPPARQVAKHGRHLFWVNVR